MRLLTDVAPTVRAEESRSGLADEAAIVAAVIAGAIIAVVIGVGVIAERGCRDRARGSDGAADHASRHVSRPESAGTLMIDTHLVLLLPHMVGSRRRVLRQSRRCDRSREHCGCGKELEVHLLSPLY